MKLFQLAQGLRAAPKQEAMTGVLGKKGLSLFLLGLGKT